MKRRWYVCRNKDCGLLIEDTRDSPLVCGACGTGRERPTPPNYLELQARVYGTTGVPKWNLGLGAWTRGKRDYERTAEHKQLVPAG